MSIRRAPRFREDRHWLSVVCFAIAAVWMLADSAKTSHAQAPSQGQPSGQSANDPVSLLRQAHSDSQDAETIDQLTAIADRCQNAIAQGGISDKWVAYGKKLQSWAVNKRGLLYDQRGEPDKALADFELAIQLDPTRWQALHNRGVSYARLGRFEDAIADFDRTVELNPDYTNAYFNRGELRYELGRFEPAIKDYTEAIRLQPEDAVAYNSRGHTYYRLGDYQNAINDYSRAIRIDSENAAAYTNRGDAYADLGYFREAANDYRSAIRIDGKLGRAYQSAAWLMATCPDERYRNAEKAVQAAQKAIELDGDSDYRYLDTMAAAYANAGQFEKARELQTKVVELAPADLVARYQERLTLYEKDSPYRDVLPEGRNGNQGTPTANRPRRSS